MLFGFLWAWLFWHDHGHAPTAIWILVILYTWVETAYAFLWHFITSKVKIAFNLSIFWTKGSFPCRVYSIAHQQSHTKHDLCITNTLIFNSTLICDPRTKNVRVKSKYKNKNKRKQELSLHGLHSLHSLRFGVSPPHLRRKHAQIFVLGHDLFLVAHSSLEDCLLLRTDYVCRQISLATIFSHQWRLLFNNSFSSDSLNRTIRAHYLWENYSLFDNVEHFI